LYLITYLQDAGFLLQTIDGENQKKSEVGSEIEIVDNIYLGTIGTVDNDDGLGRHLGISTTTLLM